MAITITGKQGLTVQVTNRTSLILPVRAGVRIKPGATLNAKVSFLDYVENLLPALERLRLAGKVNYAAFPVAGITVPPSFTNAARPSNLAAKPGTMIWNTDDQAPNFADTEGWRDATGALT